MNNHKVTRYFVATGGLTGAYVKRFFRDKVALFFTFLFPLMFLLVFGALNNNDNGPSFDVAVINHANTPFAQQFEKQIGKQESVKVNDKVTTMAQAKERRAGASWIAFWNCLLTLERLTTLVRLEASWWFTTRRPARKPARHWLLSCKMYSMA